MNNEIKKALLSQMPGDESTKLNHCPLLNNHGMYGELSAGVKNLWWIASLVALLH